MMAVTHVELPANLGAFTQGATLPLAADRDKLWYNTTENRWYAPDTNSSMWISPHPTPPGGQEVRMWTGTTDELALYDGGSTQTPITDTQGAFWEVVPEMAGFTPVGVGKIGGAGTDLAVNITIGEEKGAIVADHQHGFGVSHGNLNTDHGPLQGDQSHSGTDPNYAYMRREVNPVTGLPAFKGYLNDMSEGTTQESWYDNVTVADYITTKPLLVDPAEDGSKMQPSRGIYFIRRTARKFFAYPF
jgi:hypothetical protein